MPRRGVVVVAYGDRAIRASLNLQDGLQRTNPELPVYVISNEPTTHPGMRDVKLRMDILTPFDQTLYLDADTLPLRDVSAGFAALDDGWDVALCPSANQGGDLLWHVGAEERERTFDALGTRNVLQLQAGVMYFRRCFAVQALFAAWREEWIIYRGQDQAALLRALHRAPARVWLLGRDYNGGAVIAHNFGAARG